MALLAAVPPLANAQGVHTNPLNRDPAVVQALDRFYSLDYAGAQQRFEAIVQKNPDNPQAIALLLQNIVFRELYRQDLLDTTLYAHEGFLNGKHLTVEDPKVRDQVNQLTDRVVGLCDKRLQANPKDTDALYARGMARSLKATYVGLVERGIVTGLHLALTARDDDDQALKIDPAYVDAKLVVGIYYFVTGTLPRTLRVLAGMVGIHGDKARGLEMLTDCGKRGVIANVEARVALMIFLRHEARYKEAIAVAQALSQEFPHNFLYALETANLRKDAGDGPGAVADYRAVLDHAKQPDYYPNIHVQLAWFGLAETLRGQNDISGAKAAFREVLAQKDVGPDLKKRAQDSLNALH